MSSERTGRQRESVVSNYRDTPVVKPPVWTWEIPVYFFLGGLAGMSLLIGGVAELVANAQGRIGSADQLLRSSLWTAVIGALLSAPLLISDLGRPKRFFNMLRRFNPRSPMSMGVWILVSFSVVAGACLVVTEGAWGNLPNGAPELLNGGARRLLLPLLLVGSLLGGLLSTYTGVLLGSTVIVVWHRNRVLLPVHFGVASLGSAAALLALVVGPEPGLERLLLLAIVVEFGLIVLGGWRDRRELRSGLRRRLGRSGLLAAGAGLLLVLIPAVLLVSGWTTVAGVSFLGGALTSRFAWLEAGKRAVA